MLTTECHAFRVAFSPRNDLAFSSQDDTSHRARCASCDAYARRLEDAATPSASPFSSQLKARLSAIPQLTLGCDDIDALYAVTRQRAYGSRTESDSAAGPSTAKDSAEAHLLACRRCRDLYGRVRDAMTDDRRELPGNLFERLRQIARHPAPTLPVWVLDGRYATAVCYLLTACLILLAGDASARFQLTTEVVGARAGSWLDDRLDDGNRWLGSFTEQVDRRFVDGRAWWEEHEDNLRRSADRGAARLEDSFRSLNFDPRRWLDGEETPDPQPTEGDSDDRSD